MRIMIETDDPQTVAGYSGVAQTGQLVFDENDLPMTCSTCYWWREEDYDVASFGVCRAVFQEAEMHSTHRAHFCADWQPKTNDEASEAQQ